MARKYEYHIYLMGISKVPSGKDTHKSIYPILDHPLTRQDLLSFVEKERDQNPGYIWNVPFHALLTTYVTYEFRYEVFLAGKDAKSIIFELDHEITPQTIERDYINIEEKIESEVLNNPGERLADCNILSHTEIY